MDKPFTEHDAAKPAYISDKLGTVPLMVLHHLLMFLPWIVEGLLYVFSWHVESEIGHWPMPGVDDPKFVAWGNPISDVLYVAIQWSYSLSCITFGFFLFLTWALRRLYPKAWTWLMVILYLTGWGLFFSDPGGRFSWFLD
ncbi:MAG: hypothetical protein M3437_10395 [Chloroflexota bacterium]|nr:hypothetical protein [Chloroflexota bacterium]MDQ5866167.1 hypothetical protein [Chloroflexota bacterium]